MCRDPCDKLLQCGMLGFYGGFALLACFMIGSWLYWDSPSNASELPSTHPDGIIFVMKWISAILGAFIYPFYFWLLFLGETFWYYMYTIGICTAIMSILFAIATMILCAVFEGSENKRKRIIATISMNYFLFSHD